MNPNHKSTEAGLESCPFCEGHAITDCETDMDYPSKKFMFIRCCRCGAKTSSIYGSGDPSEWADARFNWNRRVREAATRAEMETLRADAELLDWMERTKRFPLMCWNAKDGFDGFTFCAHCRGDKYPTLRAAIDAARSELATTPTSTLKG